MGAREEFDHAYPDMVVAAYRAACRFFRFDPSRVQDVVAEAMARTFQHWDRVRRHENAIGWIVVCTKNVCLEELRHDGRSREPVAHGVPIERDFADRTASVNAIKVALWQLSKRQRDVVVLRYLLDLDEAMTAAALGTSVSKVKTAAYEARGRLRGLLAESFGIRVPET